MNVIVFLRTRLTLIFLNNRSRLVVPAPVCPFVCYHLDVITLQLPNVAYSYRHRAMARPAVANKVSIAVVGSGTALAIAMAGETLTP